MKFAIIVHGGAGEVPLESLDARKQGCRLAAEAGLVVLKRGGSALDAVQMAVTVLEDNPLFNAGIGSTLNNEGSVETDAAIMDGASLMAGAVAAVSGIRNPIQLARRVMDVGPHIMLAGEGAYRFAREQGLETCNPDELVVSAQRSRWEKEHGTVGAAALDSNGRLAAATSTGGIFDKRPGRVGDTPLIGCGTYANRYAAVSCTGLGEAIIRMTLARDAAYLVEQGRGAVQAAQEAIHSLDMTIGDSAGLILLDRNGGIGHARNTLNMPVCALSSDDKAVLES